MIPDLRLAPSALARALDGADAVALDVPSENRGHVLAEVQELVGADVLDLAALPKRPGDVLTVPLAAHGSAPARLLVLAATGDGGPVPLRRAGAAVARATKGRSRVALALARSADDDALRACVEGFALAAYSFRRSARPLPEAKTPPASAVILVEDPAARQAALERATAVAGAVHLARDLANTPGPEKSPQWLAEQAVAAARAAGCSTRVWEPRDLERDGFGGLLAVGGGSARGPRLVQISHAPRSARSAPHVVLAGKGITFDSGGLSLKPRESMPAMKADMAGAAAVVAVLAALPALGVRLRVTGLVAAAENLPSGSAYRPGDVVRTYDGTTVEVLNTDAEGRMVLADALGYARTLQPDVVVDLATLTGAATLGLGRRHAAVYGRPVTLAHALADAGTAAGDPAWVLPLVEDYRAAIDSEIADVAQVARDASWGAGSIVAALFLREFAGALPWAHVDMAGPGKVDSGEHEITAGGTGYGVRLLLEWLVAGCPGLE